MTKPHLSVRFSELQDDQLLIRWFHQPNVLKWFPLADLREIEDASRFWMSFSKHQAALTVLWDETPCGCATLYISPFEKLRHQCLFAILVDENFRGKGAGKFLLTELIQLAKERFQIELLHLEVYEGNPAINLYERLGFLVYGIQKRFVKEGNGEYLSKIMMQRQL